MEYGWLTATVETDVSLHSFDGSWGEEKEKQAHLSYGVHGHTQTLLMPPLHYQESLRIASQMQGAPRQLQWLCQSILL